MASNTHCSREFVLALADDLEHFSRPERWMRFIGMFNWSRTREMDLRLNIDRVWELCERLAFVEQCFQVTNAADAHLLTALSIHFANGWEYLSRAMNHMLALKRNHSLH